MGILDDAIRQHLDLKRRLGAEEDELKRLEDEAFGPPTRPGDPDFPETDAEGATALAEPAAESPAIDSPPPEPDESAEPPPDLPAEPGPDTGEETVDPEFPASDIAPAEPSAEAPPGPPPAAPAGPEAETSFFDQGSSESDPDPEPEPEPEEPGASASELVSEPLSDELPAAPQPGEPPIESLDTVEHPFEGAIEDTEEAELVEGEIADDEGEGEEGDDVLDQTPEFLRDQPEDDELWFEQGEPKDFDF